MIGPLSRRTLLRGIGVSLGLPLLEAMTPRRLSATAPTAAPPLRLAYIFVPGGVNVDQWTPDGEGADYRPRSTLEALTPVRDKVLVLSGLDGRHGETGANGHPLGCAPWLSTAPINERDRGGYATAITMDQVAARHYDGRTRLPSIELGCDRDATQIHTSNISWRSPSSPMGKEVNPRAVFTRLFGDPQGDAHQRSILDLVKSDADRLRKKLGGMDRLKLDEYLDSVRAIERRIQFAERDDARRDLPEFDLPEGVPTEYYDHVRILTDLMVLGFQTDATRVATFMYNNEAGRRAWPEIGISDDHHGLAHLDPRTDEGKAKLEKLQRIDRAYVEKYVYTIEKMASVREGEGTLLDHTAVVYGSGLAWGRLHNRENLPVLVGGSFGGLITGGRHVRHSRNTPLANLHLALLQKLGVKIDRVADSTEPLRQLS